MKKLNKTQIKYIVLGAVSLAVAIIALIALITCMQINYWIVADYLEVFIAFAAAGALGVIICTVGFLTLKNSPEDKNQSDAEKKD